MSKIASIWKDIDFLCEFPCLRIDWEMGCQLPLLILLEMYEIWNINF